MVSWSDFGNSVFGGIALDKRLRDFLLKLVFLFYFLWGSSSSFFLPTGHLIYCDSFFVNLQQGESYCRESGR